MVESPEKSKNIGDCASGGTIANEQEGVNDEIFICLDYRDTGRIDCALVSVQPHALRPAIYPHLKLKG
jgi:hypothetical protein